MGCIFESKMAGTSEFWLNAKPDTGVNDKPLFYHSCIFQQQWNESCRRLKLCWKPHLIRISHTNYMTRILLNSLLDYRFYDAAACVMGLCGHLRNCPELVWRTGSEVLKSLPANLTRMVQFYKYTFPVCFPYQQEMLLDLALHLVQVNQDTTEAYELLKEKTGNQPFSKDKLLRGYLGLFEYIFWKKKNLKLLSKGESLDMLLEGMEELASGLAQTAQTKEMMFHGQRSLAYFQGLVECDGVWDIFITRQVELLVYYDQKDEAKRVLMRYRERNSDNPNVHRYLYHFLKEQGATNDELIDVLEGLLKVDPTSELVGNYRELVGNTERETEHSTTKKSLSALFNKLDHSACRNNLEDWQALADALDRAYQTLDKDKWEDKVIKEFWEERMDWWPAYHFNENQNNKSDVSIKERAITSAKLRVSKRLMKKSASSVKAVKSKTRNTDKASAMDDLSTCDTMSEISDCTSLTSYLTAKGTRKRICRTGKHLTVKLKGSSVKAVKSKTRDTDKASAMDDLSTCDTMSEISDCTSLTSYVTAKGTRKRICRTGKHLTVKLKRLSVPHKNE